MPPPFALGRADGGIELHVRGQLFPIPRAHAAAVSALAWNGPLVASTSGDGLVRVWEVATGRARYELALHATALAFDPAGRWLAVASDAGLRLYDAESGRLRGELWATNSAPSALAWRRDGVTLAAGFSDGGLAVFDARTGASLGTFENGASSIVPVDLSAVPAGADLRKLQGLPGAVTSVDFGPDGREVLTASADGAIKLWDIPQRRLRRDVRQQSGRSSASALYCGETIAASDESGRGRRVPRSGADDEAHELPLPVGGTRLVRSPGGLMAALWPDGRVRVEAAPSCARAAREGFSSEVDAPLRHPAARPLQGAETEDFDPDEDEVPFTMPVDIGHPNEVDTSGRSRVNRIAWSADARRVAATLDGPLRLRSRLGHRHG